MRSFPFLVACLPLASAFLPAPAPAIPSPLRALTTQAPAPNPDLQGMVGATIETGGKVWDPLGVSNYVPASWAREAELANGRSAMLATVGWVAPQWFGLWDASDVSTADPIKAVFEADAQWWAQFVLFCGVIEANKVPPPPPLSPPSLP
jgi:hypothetical protein